MSKKYILLKWHCTGEIVRIKTYDYALFSKNNVCESILHFSFLVDKKEIPYSKNSLANYAVSKSLRANKKESGISIAKPYDNSVLEGGNLFLIQENSVKRI